MVGGGDGHDIPLPQVPQDGLGQGRSLLGVGAGAQFVNEHQGAGRYLGQDGPQVLDVGTEGGQRLLDTLLVANVGVDAVQQGKLGGLGGDVQTGVGHQGQQAYGLERDRLAPGIWPGDDHDPVVAAQLDAGGHHPLRQQGMARARDAQALCRRLNDRGHGAAVGGISALGHRHIQPGHQIQGQLQIVALVAHPGGQRPQHPLLFALLGQAGLPPPVARLYGRQGLDEYGGATVGNVVDYAGIWDLFSALMSRTSARCAG